MIKEDTIVALITPQGQGAIGVIRISGNQSFSIIEKIFFSNSGKSVNIKQIKSHSIRFGLIKHEGIVIDEVLVSIFKGPNSYTGEDTIEISCHGSSYIIQKIIQLIISLGGRTAEPGEFTLRAFLNGKLDLSQAEAVADLIASNSAVSHQVAMEQMRGGFSNKIAILREQLVNFASLIELELDFSEEDVEFADRTDLKKLIDQIINIVEKLLSSFELGNVIKKGIPVAIVGKPNAGKSTLLNLLLEEEKAIVSEIPGTTRDIIEDEIVIGGVMFRFIDTAGIRTTNDIIEQIGVNKALDAIKKSAIIVYLFDSHEIGSGDLRQELELINNNLTNAQVTIVANKSDTENLNELKEEFSEYPEIIYISAKEGNNIQELKSKLLALFDARTINATDTIVTNARHAESLRRSNEALRRVLEGLNTNIPSDLLAIDIRKTLDELGAITGQVTNEDLLDNIFSKFCIGK
ncbi:MAG: tRNA uridine-5-carboxymethylaminomethyl(34) synthesis GTPase MnmE [Bacteroidia bacterium]